MIRGPPALGGYLAPGPLAQEEDGFMRFDTREPRANLPLEYTGTFESAF